MEAKINKKNIISKRAGMSYTQILILIISSFAFSYLIYSVTEVSAQTEEVLPGYSCCEKTTSGNYCQFVPEENCNSSFQKAPTECKYTDFCKLGCCYSEKTGWCNENTPQRSCQESGGVWKEDAFCNIAECQRGCCVLGRNAIFTTQRNCQVEAGFLGLSTDFKPEIKTEIECIFLAEKDDEGACVFEEDFEKICKFTTRESCKNSGGDFYKNTFCSDSGLGTECKAHDHVGCAKNEIGNDESVYWFDSCGNKEEVKEECSIFVGTICGLVEEEYKCKSIDCEVEINGAKVKKKNGESWCEYEGTIGNGKDVVGSRHVKHICFMGEERIEPCEDYRNQICVQSDNDLGNGNKFSEAACRINNWRSCLDYNTLENKEKSKEKCEENPDCFVKKVDIDNPFKFDVCIPNYPPGFDLTSEASGRNAELVCSMASQKCTVVYVKTLFSGWKCKVNCNCESAEFAEKMNDFCTSLGDCGAYVNFAGEVTDDGYSVKGSPKLSSTYLNSLKKYAITKPGQKAEPGNLSFLFGSLGVPSGEVGSEGKGGSYLGAGLGMVGVGFALQVASLWNAGLELGEAILEAAEFGGNIGPLGSFGNALAGAGAMLAVGSLLTQALGIKGEGAKIIMIASIVAAGVTAYIALATAEGLAGSFLGFIPYDPLTLVILVIIIIIVKILGIGKTKTKIVTFNCLPWQSPTGGANCGKCNSNDPLGVPCSNYRCKSLGQTCELVNEGTGQETCIDNNPNDVSSPRISPLLGTITEGYQYVDTKNNNFLDGFEILDLHKNCIPEFTNVVFGIKTDKPSQCKIGTSAMQIYDDMEEFFGGSNLYLKNHTTLLNIPSPEAFANQYNLTDAQIKQLGEINFYVKCKSVNGVENIAAYTIRSCVKPGPDLTVPYVTKTSPVNGAFVKYDATKQLLSLWTNEPSNCKWSIEDKKDYSLMENLMSCKQDLEDYGLYGWPCNTTLDVSENNKFYIKCQDISDNKNTMRQSYVYELKKSESNLEITEIKPANGEEIIAATEPMTLTLEVVTASGAESGKAECFYKFREEYDYIRFYDTFSDYHKQVFSSIIRGDYKIYIKCQDVAGNTAENFTEFSVKIDTSAPVITRVYYDGSLMIMTNENAICAYSFTDTKCKFEIENATQAELMSGEEKEHSAEWQTDAVYYIKCKDNYGNKPGGCSIIVKLYDVI